MIVQGKKVRISSQPTGIEDSSSWFKEKFGESPQNVLKITCKIPKNPFECMGFYIKSLIKCQNGVLTVVHDDMKCTST